MVVKVPSSPLCVALYLEGTFGSTVTNAASNEFSFGSNSASNSTRCDSKSWP